jgi:hypothetical protein
VDKSDLQAILSGTGTTISIKDVGLVLGVEVFDSLFVELIEHFRLGGSVNIIPINVLCRLCSGIVNNPLILGTAA